MANDERDRTNGDSTLPSGKARVGIETLHGVGRVPNDQELDLPRHDTDVQAERESDSNVPSDKGSGGIETMHGGGVLPNDEDLDLPSHDQSRKALPTEHNAR